MGQAGPACWGHQLATTRQHEQPGPLSPHLQALATPSSLAGPTMSPRGPSRLAKPRAGTDVSRWLPLGPTRPDHLSPAALSMCPKTGLQSSGGCLPPAVAANRLRPDAAGAPLILKRAPQVQPGSTTGPQEAHADCSPAPYSSSPPGRLLASPGSSGRRKTVSQGRPGLRHACCATLRGRAAPRPRPTGPTHAVAAQLCRGLPQKAASRPDRLQGCTGVAQSSISLRPPCSTAWPPPPRT
ncbi:hypothetical protein NDU88_004528 [Pleurodeles waltl]|uniref:Uncharacterized protein n=1 Tax=Pleurodeles waltl TaxID=8319 RepID=A0AAV7M7D8_PLEWA|nr:hypothetical protein NDU88_004528 [Pleurodeles waltl]